MTLLWLWRLLTRHLKLKSSDLLKGGPSIWIFQTFSFTLNPVFHVVFACAKLTGSVSLTKAQVVRKRKCVGALFAHSVLVAELVI